MFGMAMWQTATPTFGLNFDQEYKMQKMSSKNTTKKFNHGGKEKVKQKEPKLHSCSFLL